MYQGEKTYDNIGYVFLPAMSADARSTDVFVSAGKMMCITMRAAAEYKHQLNVLRELDKRREALQPEHYSC